MPQFAREIAVVAGNLLVGGDLVVELDLGEGQAVEEQFAAFDPGGVEIVSRDTCCEAWSPGMSLYLIQQARQPVKSMWKSNR